MPIAVLALLLAAPLRVAVMPTAAGEGVSEKTAAAVTEALAAEVRRVPSTQVITQREISSLLSLERQRQILGCQTDACMAEIGGALGVDRLVVGDLALLGRSWLFHVKLLDVARAQVVAQSDRRLREATVDDLLDQLPDMVKELLPAAPGGSPGTGRTGTSATAPTPALAPPWVEEPAALAPDDAGKLRVWRGPEGLVVAAVPFGSWGPLLAGDASALHQQLVIGGGSQAGAYYEWNFWDPRARVGAEAEFGVRDGAAKLTCGDRSIPVEPLSEADGAALLARAKLLAFRWRRYAHSLARDDAGTYYYVDGARKADGRRAAEPDLRLHVGPKGKLAAVAVRDVISDEGGEALLTAQGTLRTRRAPDGKLTVEWQDLRGGKVALQRLEPDRNAQLIYGALGVYAGERLGTPCDRFLGR